jgi:lysophospholipase L1-like esterase
MKLLLLSSVLLLVPPGAGTARIVCIGDSITQGRKGGGANKPTQSYRYPLWKALVDAGADVDFVGSLKGGFEGDPEWPDYKGRPFDRDHEGHWGWTTRGVREKLPEWIRNYTPDVALLLLGTNDVSPHGKMTVEDTKKEMGLLVDLLRGRNPKVVVLLGQCFPEWKPFPELRTKMEEFAREKSTAASPVVIVDHSRGWVSKPDAAGSHTVDWVHPNESGDAKLAGNWMETLRPHLKRLGAVK